MFHIDRKIKPRPSWNKGKLIGQKPLLKLQEVWAIRIRLELANQVRDLALFSLAIDSKLRGCDLVKLKVSDVTQGTSILKRAMVMQQKIQRPVQFEITEKTRDSLSSWIEQTQISNDNYLFKGKSGHTTHLSTRQYARIVKYWVSEINLDPNVYGTHSLRRTKATLIYRQSKNIRAIQLLLGHTKLESTVRYLGIEVDDALEFAEQIEV